LVNFGDRLKINAASMVNLNIALPGLDCVDFELVIYLTEGDESDFENWTFRK
jgi:hypothetical protein